MNYSLCHPLSHTQTHTRVHTLEHQRQQGVEIKNQFWGYKVQHGDYSSQYCIIYLKFDESRILSVLTTLLSHTHTQTHKNTQTHEW